MSHGSEVLLLRGEGCLDYTYKDTHVMQQNSTGEAMYLTACATSKN